MSWTSVKEKLPLPGLKVIALFYTELGLKRTIMAMHLPEIYTECSCETECDCEYYEPFDTSYYPEGWYEVVENWEEWGFIPVIEGEVTHWMSLPKEP